jgi:hypothetical protein
VTKADELSEKSKTLSTAIETVSGEVKQFETTQKLREEAPSATLMHIVGMFTGYGCVMFLCPEALTPWSERVGRLVNGLISAGRKRKNKQFRQSLNKNKAIYHKSSHQEIKARTTEKGVNHQVMREILVGRDIEDQKRFGMKATAFLAKHYVKTGDIINLSGPIFMDLARPHIILVCGKRG